MDDEGVVVVVGDIGTMEVEPVVLAIIKKRKENYYKSSDTISKQSNDIFCILKEYKYKVYIGRIVAYVTITKQYNNRIQSDKHKKQTNNNTIIRYYYPLIATSIVTSILATFFCP